MVAEMVMEMKGNRIAGEDDKSLSDYTEDGVILVLYSMVSVKGVSRFHGAETNIKQWYRLLTVIKYVNQTLCKSVSIIYYY